MRDKITRREFLKQSAMAASALALSPLQASGIGQAGLKKKGPAKKIVVIGAGLSGLSAAYELAQAGHDLTVLEARARPGGRVLTLREPFADGMHAEAGAARIHAEHGLTLHYARLFGLDLDPMYPNDLSFVSYTQSKRWEINWLLYAQAVARFTSVGLGRESRVWFKVRGGNDQIPKAMAARLSEKVIYNSPVVRVEQDARGVRATFVRGGSRQTIAGDYLICTVPFSVINRIEFAPALSDKKRALIEKAAYSSITRTFLQVKDRYWLRQGLNGFAVTDDPMEVWHSTFNRPGRRGILVSYARYEYSKRITAMSEGERVSHMVTQVEKIFPGLKDHFEKGLAKCWDEDEWARGAWTDMGWGQTHKIAKPDGRVYLAGDHFSTATSWMQGALESGNRVAKEINDAR